MPAIAVTKGIMFGVVCLSHSCERDISGTHLGDFFKFVTNIHLDWFEIGGQRSKSLCPRKTHFLTITQPFIWWLRPKKKKSLITCWRSKVNFVVTSSFCEKMFWPLFNTCGDIQPQDGDSSPIIIVPRMSVYFWIWLTVQLLSFHCHNMLSVCDNSE